jgi:hypothetical protein
LTFTLCALESPAATLARRDNIRSVNSYPLAMATPRSAPKIAFGPGTGIANKRQQTPMAVE